MGKKTNKNNIQKTQKEVSQHFQIFVSGLPYQTTQEQIKQFFAFANQPKIKLPKYQDTGRCLGYGHIEFSTQQQFNQAILKDGQYIGTRFVNVRAAKGKKQPQAVQIKSIPVGCKVLFIKNLPYQINKQQLKREFSSCGVIKEVRMIRNWQTKKFKGFAYIDFNEVASVKKAIAKYHGKQFKGRNLVCDAVITNAKKGFKKDHTQQDQVENNNQIQNQQDQQ